MAFRTAPRHDTDIYGTVLTDLTTGEFDSDDDWGTSSGGDWELHAFGVRGGQRMPDAPVYRFPEERMCMGEAI